MEALEKKSGIVYLKSKFFLIRVVTYFSFLLLPIFLQKTVNMSMGYKLILMISYIFFMIGQWFLLGKEIDHRLKIYFKVNSTIDRLVYRVFMGMFFTILYFNILAFIFPSKWIYNIFWVTWVVLGLYYSWPTRGKIIQESASSNIKEFNYLDSFERTLMLLTAVMFFISIPQLPNINDFENLKLFFDPLSRVTNVFWNFVLVNYYPFKNYPSLFKVAVSLHFYIVGIGLFLLSLYAFLRYFTSRRLSLLGVFALVSSWSVSKILSANFGDAIVTTYSVLWIWSFIWVTKSSSYRTGLFLGLVGFYGTLLNPHYYFFVLASFPLIYYFLHKIKNRWYIRQTFKYMLLGLALGTLVFLFEDKSYSTISIDQNYVKLISHYLSRKAFFLLSLVGILLISMVIISPKWLLEKNFNIDRFRLKQFGILLGLIVLFSLIGDSFLIYSFGLLWVFAFLSVIPIEYLFQVITRLRSRRNMIYLLYIIACLLDSHFEGRVKILYRIIESSI